MREWSAGARLIPAHSHRVFGVLGAFAVCGYLLFFRVHDLDESFWLLSEQVRDWLPTQGPVQDLPLAGPRSLNSGADIGPAYYWFLWLSHAILAPVLGEFPHTGGWAISLLHTGGDFALFMALWRRFESWPLAAAIVLLLGSSPHDAGLTSTIWNPPVAVAFVKVATASLLWNQALSTLTSTVSIVCVWIAVQMHLTAIVVAVPITLWVAYTAGSSESVSRMATCAGALIASLALVVLPYALNPIAREGGGIGGSLSVIAADPIRHLRVDESAVAVGHALDTILATPLNGRWFVWLMAIGAAVIVVTKPLSSLAACSVGAIATTIGAFSLWQGRFGEFYWFLVIGPAGAICAFAPVALLGSRLRNIVGCVLLASIFALQPARSDIAWTWLRLPAYGPLRRGAIAVATSGQPVRGVTADFEVPHGVDPAFLLRLAGGRLDPAASMIAVIQRDGSIRFSEN